MEDFVTYKQATELKELGFDWEYGKGFQYKTYYNSLKRLGQFDEEITTTEIPAPTLSQAQKWLREKHNIIIVIDTYFKNYLDDDYSKAEFQYVIIDMNHNAVRKQSKYDDEIFDNYEQALSSGIDKALELIRIK